MTCYTDKNRDLLVLLARRFPELSVYDVCRLVGHLHSLARRWQTATEHWCNGTKDEDWVDKTRESVRAKTRDVLAHYEVVGLEVTLTGDPRGYTFKLVPLEGTAEFPTNTWGKDGWGVE